jgi:predicted outer membrane repeat protein
MQSGNVFKKNLALLTSVAVVCLLCIAQPTWPDPGGSFARAGIERLNFTARPDLGYVVISQPEKTAISALEATLKEFGAEDIRPIKGLGRKGNYVVFCNRPANENINTIKNLRAKNHISFAAPLFSSNGEIVAIIPEIVVRLKDKSYADELRNLCRNMNLSIKKKMEFTELEYLIEVLGNDADAVTYAAEQLNRNPFIEWATPNKAFEPKLCGQVIPNDQYFPKLWHLNNTGQSGGTPNADINAPEAWEITTGNPNIIIAILDNGVDVNHPDLINNLVPGYDFYDDDPIPEPHGSSSLEHGTACAGLAAARGNNSIGVTGVAWNCKIMPICIASWGIFGLIPEADVATAFRWAAANGADVISNSWGYLSIIVWSAIVDVTEPGGIGREGKGCIVLAAAGNGARSPIICPAAYPEVIAVGATDHNDRRFSYSQYDSDEYGFELDLMAPSGSAGLSNPLVPLWTTCITGLGPIPYYDYTFYMSGTSGATPIAAGVAALILSVDPDLTNLEVLRFLTRSAVDLNEPGLDYYYGYGRVDARAALEMTLNPPSPFWFVDDNAPDDPGPGDPDVSDPCEDGSAEHPFDAIQEAIDAAFPAETIIVLPGTYMGQGNRDIDFKGKSIILSSQNGPQTCIIDCQNADRAFNLVSSLSSNAVLKGFTITNGNADLGGGIYIKFGNPKIINCIINGCSAEYGGGLYGPWVDFYEYDQYYCPTLIDCTFSNNSATLKGGGMYNSGRPTLTNCTFSGNSANRGGGIFNEPNSSPTLTNCNFVENTAQTDGGAIYNDTSTNFITKCIFSDNSAQTSGGAMFNNNNSNSILTNCIFGRNSAQYGGGIVNNKSTVELTNCTFNKNSANSGGGIYTGSSKVTMTNCILWADTPEEIVVFSGVAPRITYSDVQGGRTGVGNINTDPCFADADNGDYHLKSVAGRWNSNTQTWVTDGVTSLCIDAGNPLSDWTSELWPHGKRINMGAFGGTPQASMSNEKLGNIADLNVDDFVNYGDMDLLKDKWLNQEILLKEDLSRNGCVDFKDFCIFAENWLWEQ